MHVMPRRAKSQASVMPTGPPPAMRTWTSFTPVLLATTAVPQGQLPCSSQAGVNKARKTT
jgi:hypothetical protein